jgi:hypothetical protein
MSASTDGLICDDAAIMNWLKDEEVTQIIARLTAGSELA